MGKKILILVFSNLKKDARVSRQIDFLKSQYDVTVVCYDAEPKGFSFIPIKQVKLSLFTKLFLLILLALRSFRKAIHTLYPYNEVKQKIGNEEFDLIIANDVETLMLAFDLSKSNTKVIFDAHEYAPRHFEDKFVWKLFFQPMNIFLCKKYLHQTHGMMTIGQGLANEYRKNFDVNPVIITNASNYLDVNPHPISGDQIRLVHHGIATPSRKLELMIEMVTLLDPRFSLDMYLLSEGFVAKKTINYPEKLKALAASTGRVRILPPIDREKITSTINQYDIGVFLIPPVNFNYENTLPNKFFDFIQARLAIAIGPTPEMATLVNHYKIGVVSSDFSPEKLAEQLNSITQQQLASFKQNSIQAAKELNSEFNTIRLNELVKLILEK